MKKDKWNYNYSKITENKSQYDDCDFETENTVDAKYMKSEFSIDTGNPFIEALPLPRNFEETLIAYDKPLEFQKYVIDSYPKEKKLRSVSMLRQLRIPLPFHAELESTFYDVLVTSYRSRYICTDNNSPIEVTINNKEEKQYSVTHGDQGDAANAGFALIGYSGTGKSSSLNVLLSNYPQVIYHYPHEGERVPQIVYLVVNCVTNSNFSALYESIGSAIDRALGNLKPCYSELINRQKNLGKKANKICELIDLFSIGVIIFDEIQLIDFASTKENSFESLLTMCNRTKVGIGIIGTEEAYDLMFTKLRTARRIGRLIDCSSYCTTINFFKFIVNYLFKYQWFDEIIAPTDEIINALYENSLGIIDQVIALYGYLQIDYINRTKKKEINKEYIDEVAKKYCRGSKKMLNGIVHPENEKIRKELEQVNLSKLNNLFTFSNTSYDKKILEQSSATSETDILIANVIKNVLNSFEQFNSAEITNVAKKILSKNIEQKLDERTLTRMTVQRLLNTTDNKPKRKVRKKSASPSITEMEDYLLG